MTEKYVDPGHRLPDEDWAKVVARAKEIREQTEAEAQGGAASGIAPLLDMTALGIASKKYFPVSGIPTQLLVLHSGECPLQGGFARSLTEWAAVPYPADPIASWQWFVDPLAIVNFVPAYLGAWHASEANNLSEGFEQAGYARYSRADWLTPDGQTQLESLAWIMAQRAIANDIPPRWLSTAEVTAATSGNRSIKGFCTHRQIDPETRTDPGNGYPLDLLMQRVQFYMAGGTINTQSTEEIPEDFMSALTDDQQRELYRTLCTDEGRALLARAVVNYPVPWYGFDGKQPTSGRTTVNLTAVLGWQDAAFAGLAGRLDGVQKAVSGLSTAKVELTADDLGKLAATLKDALAPGLAAELARRLAD